MAGSKVPNFEAGYVTLGALGIYVLEHQLYDVYNSRVGVGTERALKPFPKCGKGYKCLKR